MILYMVCCGVIDVFWYIFFYDFNLKIHKFFYTRIIETR